MERAVARGYDSSCGRCGCQWLLHQVCPCCCWAQRCCFNWRLYCRLEALLRLLWLQHWRRQGCQWLCEVQLWTTGPWLWWRALATAAGVAVCSSSSSTTAGLSRSSLLLQARLWQLYYLQPCSKLFSTHFLSSIGTLKFVNFNSAYCCMAALCSLWIMQFMLNLINVNIQIWSQNDLINRLTTAFIWFYGFNLNGINAILPFRASLLLCPFLLSILL